MPLIRRLALLVGTVALAGALGAGAAAPAAAAEELPLQFSFDGISWMDSIPSIVPASWEPVPGSSYAVALHVRSERSATSNVALYVSDARSLSATLLAATSVTGELASVGLGDPDTCRALAAATFAPGQQRIFTIRIDVAPELRDAQSTGLSFDLAAAMSDPEVSAAGPGCAATPVGPGALPSTGGDPHAMLLAAVGGAAGVAIGWWVLRRRRGEDV